MAITERSIVQAYHAYGQELWNKIKPHNRERDYIKWWLRECLNKFDSGEAIPPR